MGDSNENGERQYHNTNSAYVLPNDAREQDRLDTQAAAIVEMLGGAPFLAPFEGLKNASKAVDVGCGTGVATVQIANKIPSAKVYGLDISPVPPAVQKIAPGNAAWAIGNVLDVDNKESEGEACQEIFAPSGLDYVFGRMLFLGLNDWSRYFSIASRALKSGGIIEHQDLDWAFYRVASSECLSDKWEWYQAVVSGLKKAGLSTRSGSGAAQLMAEAGLEVIGTHTFEFSFVPSTKTPNSQAMGRYVQAKLLPNYPELLRKILSDSGASEEEIKRLSEQCLRDIVSEEGIHQKYTVTIARKP
ncbi:predicted protein [Uncinocarpus reesii 1704]|uniref:Methyltransferase domain-containing protein n=1 Tax=Uncinocarpus reesii (strain UAMH 1704) TaxID=336963 RepID=C4JFV4_UNCRE|nr:uncharacterized protein UREG_01034 [Uncinocarpus reesii 1704]EEP76185.1 predicted protein [Uncinocarpus reesii 1704]